MIIIYRTLCPTCKAKTNLRLQIGNLIGNFDEVQPFFYICSKCETPTRGVVHASFDTEFPKIDLELEGGEILEKIFRKPDQTITVALDLPCLLFDDGSPQSQYPFFHQVDLMGGSGKKIDELMKRLKQFRGVIKSDWPKFRRLIVHYQNQDWKRFNTEWKNIFEDAMPIPKNDFERIDLFYKVLELIFVPLQPDFDYPILKTEFNGLLIGLYQSNSDELYGFANYLINSKELQGYERNLLERLSFIVDHFSALSPGFPILLYSVEGKQEVERLRIMRDDFEILKAHYLSCYEICHKTLNILVGLINLSERGNINAFSGNKPKTLNEYKKLANARKVEFLDSNVFPEISSRWSVFFDRQLRNAIGHYSIHHDLITGKLVIDDFPPVPYSVFVANTLNILPMILFSLQVVKMMYLEKAIRRK